jgi:hypothetical protein
MAHAQTMLDSYPGKFGFPADDLAAAIEACIDCAQTCTACADACLAEDDVAQLRRCIATDLNCADICSAVGRLLSRQTDYDAQVTQRALEACIRACVACADECEKHAQHHRHCGVCAEVCRACAAACTELLNDEVEQEMRALQGG